VTDEIYASEFMRQTGLVLLESCSRKVPVPPDA
jgi:hypothetical protein